MGVPWWIFAWIPLVVVLPIVFNLWMRRKALHVAPMHPIMMQPGMMQPGMMQPGMMQPGMMQPGMMSAPAPTHIKKTPCRNCGALKVTPPKTASLYCDFCGTLVDWDLRMSMAAGLNPARELSRLSFAEGARRTHAIHAGDREAYRQSVLRVWEQHMALCPAAYSPRIGDPAYRQRLLHYLGIVDTEIGFDAEARPLEQAVAHARNAFPRQPGPPVHPHVLAQLVSAKKATLDRVMTIMAPHLHLHPDESTPELARAIMSSTFVQAILPFLDPPRQQWLIHELGLGGEYAPIAAVQTTERHCGTCGGVVTCASGATRVLCESCGHFNDVSRAEIACPECGGHASLPVGTHVFACPSCRADMRVG
jgi:hypothetical protein